MTLSYPKPSSRLSAYFSSQEFRAIREKLSARVLVLLKQAFICDPKELYGTAEVTRELKNTARHNANLLSISSLVNTIGLAPYLLISLSGFGLLTYPIASIVMAMLNGASNISGTIAAKHHRGNRLWAYGGLVTFIGMNVFYSLFTGPGIVLFTDKPKIQARLAEEVILNQSQRNQVLNRISPQLKQLESDIAIAQQRQQEIERQEGKAHRDNPEWNRLQVRLWGPYEKVNQDWTTVKEANLPLIHRFKRLEARELEAFQSAEEKLNRTLANRVNYGDDIQFLAQEMPRHYEANFHPNGELKSGAKGAEIATHVFLHYLTSGQFAKLAFPLLMAGISLILSASVCYLTYSFARTQAVVNSHDPLKQARLQKAINQLRQQR